MVGERSSAFCDVKMRDRSCTIDTLYKGRAHAQAISDYPLVLRDHTHADARDCGVISGQQPSGVY